MKALAILAFYAVCSCVFATEVVSTGYGRTVEEATRNAKTNALEQVTGTFVIGKSTAEGDVLTTRIDEYNGGLIRKHTVVSTQESAGLIEVVMKADVDTDKVNNIIVSDGGKFPDPANLQQSRDDFERTKAIVDALDDPTQAFAVRVGKIAYANRGATTTVTVEAWVVYSPKWYDDVRLMARTMGRKIDIGSWWTEALWGIGALAAIANPALTGVIHSVAREVETKPKESAEYMACFGDDNGWDVDECHEIRHPLIKTLGRNRLRIGGMLRLGDDEIPLKKIIVNTESQLYMSTRTGQRAYFQKSGKERRFFNPGVVLFKKGYMPFSFTLDLPTTALTKASGLELKVVALALPMEY
jgi:hypothetical protein